MFPAKNEEFFQFGEFEVDASKRSLRRGTEVVPLNPKAFDLLVALLEKHGEVVTKSDLLDRVWPDQFVEEGNLTVHIAAIRRALGETKNGNRFIATVPGRGYQFVGEVRLDSDDVIIEEHSISRITLEETDLNITASSGLDHLVAPAKDHAVWRFSSRIGAMSIGAAAIVFIAFVAYFTFPRILAGHGSFGVNLPEKSVRQITAVGTASNAALSPDGKSFVYQTFENGQYTVWFGSTNGGYRVQIVPPGLASHDGLTFSPNADLLFYVSGGDLYKMPSMGGPAEKILAGVPPTFGLSKDGEEITYVKHGKVADVDSLVVAEISTGVRRDVLTFNDGRKFSSYPAFSRDGTNIAIGITGGNGEVLFKLSQVELDNGAITILGDETWNQISKTAWMNDGSGILFNAIGPNSDFHIWFYDNMSGATRCITDDLSRYGRASLSVSNDGTELLLVRDEVNSSLWVTQSDAASQLRRVTSGTFGKLDGSAGLAWRPDGKLVYSSFFDNGFSLWTVDPNEGEPKQLTPSGSKDRFPSVSRDGRFLIFESNRDGHENIWRVNSDGLDLVQLTTGSQNTLPDITPDGSNILYSTEERGATSIWRVPIEGGQPLRLTGDGYDFAKVSPDGLSFVCLRSNTSTGPRPAIVIMPIGGGEPTTVFEPAPTAAFNNGFHWTPDGSAVVYRDNSSGLWRQLVAGGSPQKMSGIPDERIYYFDWSANDHRLAFAYGSELRDVVLIRNFH